MELINFNALIALERVLKMQMDQHVHVVPANGVFRLPKLRRVDWWVN